MKSRIATTLTMVLLLAGTGGAIAIGESGSHSGPEGGAACGQYNPGHQKNGKPCKNHHCGKHHNQACKHPKKHHKAKHGKTHKAPPTHHKTTKSKGKTGGKPHSNCTLRKASHGVVILYCP